MLQQRPNRYNAMHSVAIVDKDGVPPFAFVSVQSLVGFVVMIFLLRGNDSVSYAVIVMISSN